MHCGLAPPPAPEGNAGSRGECGLQRGMPAPKGNKCWLSMGQARVLPTRLRAGGAGLPFQRPCPCPCPASPGPAPARLLLWGGSGQCPHGGLQEQCCPSVPLMKVLMPGRLWWLLWPSQGLDSQAVQLLELLGLHQNSQISHLPQQVQQQTVERRV